MSSHIALVVDNPAPRSRPGTDRRPNLNLLAGTGRVNASNRPANCLDCTDCTGTCTALLETVNLPDAILNRRRRRS